MQYESNGIILTCDTDIDEDEAQGTIDYFLEKHPRLEKLEVTIDGDFADVQYWETSDRKVPFERIRRITGYLVGTLDRFNDGKRAEEAARVKHSL